jgi:hypothetical protein
VLGTSNNVPVQELETFRRLVSKLRRDGHMSGTAADSTEDCQSKVIKRYLRAKSPRFLLSKEEALAGYIQENKRAYDQLAGRS